MISLGNGIWTVDQPLQLLGLELGTKMTIVKLHDGTLWLHSPVRPTEVLQKELLALGKISSIVAPNLFHHLYVKYYRPLSTSAKFFGVAGFEKKRPDLKFDLTLEPGVANPWPEDFEMEPLRGIRSNEVVFFHKSSKTLVVTDLVMNLPLPKQVSKKILMKFLGLGGFRASRLTRLAVYDHSAFKQSMDRVLSWDFDKISLPHGPNILTNGHALMKEACRAF